MGFFNRFEGMKLIKCFTLALILSLSLSSLAKAAPVKKVVDNNFLNKAKEKNLVMNTLQVDAAVQIDIQIKELNRKELKGLKNYSEIEVGDPYKIYHESNDLIKGIVEKQKLRTVFEKSNYYWEAPLIIKKGVKHKLAGQAVSSLILLPSKDNGWGLSQSGYYPTDIGNLLSDSNKISQFISDKGINDINYYAFFQSGLLKSYFMYIENNDNQFFIPIHYWPTLVKIKSMDIYTLDQMSELVNSELKANENIDPNATLGGNISPKLQSSNESNNSRILLYILGISAIIGFLLVTFGNKRSKTI